MAKRCGSARACSATRAATHPSMPDELYICQGIFSRAAAAPAQRWTVPSAAIVHAALCATSQTYPSGSANAPLVPPHSATAAGRTIRPRPHGLIKHPADLAG